MLIKENILIKRDKRTNYYEYPKIGERYIYKKKETLKENNLSIFQEEIKKLLSLLFFFNW